MFRVQKPVFVSVLPTSLFQKLFGLFNIIFVFIYIGVIRPGVRHIGSCCRTAKTEEHHVNNLVLIYGIGDGLPHPSVAEPGMFLIECQVRVTECRVTVFLEIILEK